MRLPPCGRIPSYPSCQCTLMVTRVADPRPIHYPVPSPEGQCGRIPSATLERPLNRHFLIGAALKGREVRSLPEPCCREAASKATALKGRGFSHAEEFETALAPEDPHKSCGTISR